MSMAGGGKDREKKATVKPLWTSRRRRVTKRSVIGFALFLLFVAFLVWLFFYAIDQGWILAFTQHD